jgi:hypothetical protein
MTIGRISRISMELNRPVSRISLVIVTLVRKKQTSMAFGWLELVAHLIISLDAMVFVSKQYNEYSMTFTCWLPFFLLLLFLSISKS